MTEKKTLTDGPARGALAEGADKFDRIARSLKAPKPGEVQSVSAGDAPRMTAIAPDEIWARNYMTYAIGTKPELSTPVGIAPIAHLVSMPKFTPANEPFVAKAAEIVKAAAPVAIEPMRQAPAGPIGVQIGKPMRKRSWLGRVFLSRA